MHSGEITLGWRRRSGASAVVVEVVVVVPGVPAVVLAGVELVVIVVVVIIVVAVVVVQDDISVAHARRCTYLKQDNASLRSAKQHYSNTNETRRHNLNETQDDTSTTCNTT